MLFEPNGKRPLLAIIGIFLRIDEQFGQDKAYVHGAVGRDKDRRQLQRQHLGPSCIHGRHHVREQALDVPGEVDDFNAVVLVQATMHERYGI